MSYAQPFTQRILDPDHLHRKVLVAVEVVDPIAQTFVSRGLIVKARGLTGQPVVSWSGRFVWLEENDVWPEAISIQPVRLPFEKQEVTPPRPPNFPNATAAERRVRIVLRPTPAYPFDGLTAVRGGLRESLDPASPVVPDVLVQLKWRDLDSNSWLPTAPSQIDSRTNADGQFAAVLRLNQAGSQEPDIVHGALKVRLEFTRGDFMLERRATPDDFPFVSDPNQTGRVPEGRLLSRDLRLGWADLLPI
jgi:hypothetical protein